MIQRGLAPPPVIWTPFQGCTFLTRLMQLTGVLLCFCQNMNNRKLSAYRPLPPETLKSLREYYRVGLTYTSNALLMRDENDTVNDTVKRLDTSHLSKTEQAVLDAISMHPDYSYEQLATACSVSRPTIARTVKSLQVHNRIRRVGSDKTGHWELINEGQGRL